MSKNNPPPAPLNSRKHRPPRLLALLLIGPMIFLSVFAPQNTGNNLQQEDTPAVTETPVPELADNGYPSEFIGNPDQTNGIILGGVLLVIIIIGGVFSAVGRKKPPTNQQQ